PAGRFLQTAGGIHRRLQCADSRTGGHEPGRKMIMRRVVALLLACAGAALVAGCSSASKVASDSAPASGERSKQGAFLASEHRVSVRYANDVIAAREDALRKACGTEQFGQCSLLGIKQTSGRFPGGEVVLRVAPDAVEPLVKLAAEGGAVSQRETRAEDL